MTTLLEKTHHYDDLGVGARLELDADRVSAERLGDDSGCIGRIDAKGKDEDTVRGLTLADDRYGELSALLWDVSDFEGEGSHERWECEEDQEHREVTHRLA